MQNFDNYSIFPVYSKKWQCMEIFLSFHIKLGISYIRISGGAEQLRGFTF